MLRNIRITQVYWISIMILGIVVQVVVMQQLIKSYILFYQIMLFLTQIIFCLILSYLHEEESIH